MRIAYTLFLLVGWMGNVGIRFNQEQELSFSTTVPLQNTVGPIQHPLSFALTYAFHIKKGIH